MKEYIKKENRLNIFDKLDYNSAYLIGYLCGDGSFKNGLGKRTDRLSVSSINKKTIEWVRDSYCPITKITSRLPINKKRNIKTTTLSHHLTFPVEFAPVFSKYGILFTKKNRKCVGISIDNFKSYLKGLIDADGCFSSGRRKDRNRLWVNFQITHQSVHVLGYVQKFLHEHLNISTFVNQRREEDCLDLKVSKIESVVVLINWLYSDNNCRFDKKYQADKFLSLYNEQYPNAS